MNCKKYLYWNSESYLKKAFDSFDSFSWSTFCVWNEKRWSSVNGSQVPYYGLQKREMRLSVQVEKTDTIFRTRKISKKLYVEANGTKIPSKAFAWRDP